MFYLRLNKIKIFNNRELLGKAEVQFMSFITKGDNDFPMLDKLFTITDKKERETLLNEAIKKVVSSRILMPIYKVKDNHQIIFGDTGYSMYQTDSIPDNFNWTLHAIELDGRTRDNAAIISDSIKEAEDSNLLNTIIGLATKSTKIIESIVEITKLVTKVLSKNKDDQIGLFITSFIRQLDYPHGLRNRTNVPDTTGNMLVDYTIFGTDRII